MIKNGSKATYLLALIAIFALAACQALPSAAQPAPFTGSRASVVGASALALQQQYASVDTLLVPISAATGRAAPGYPPIDLGENPRYDLSPSHGLFVFLSKGAGGCLKGCLHVLDLRAWKETIQPVPITLQYEGWTTNFSFDSQGRRVAFAENDPVSPTNRVALVDLDQGKLVAEAKLAYNVSQVNFTPANELVVQGVVTPPGKDPVAHVALLDGNNLQVRWEQDLDQVHYSFETSASLSDPSLGRYLYPAVLFTPDHSRLYIVNADEAGLVSVDFTRRSVQHTLIEPPKSWLNRLVAGLLGPVDVAYAKTLNGTIKTAVLSGDGKTLYVTGQTSTAVKDHNGDWTAKYTPLGLQAIDVASGTQTASLQTEASSLLIGPDGEDLFLTGWNEGREGLSNPWTDIVAAKDFRLVAHLDAQIQPTRLLDGSQAWLSSIPQGSGNPKLAISMPGSPAQWKALDSSYTDWVAVP